MIFTDWPPLFVVDVEGNGANPPDLVEVAALPVRDGRPDTSTAGAWLIRPPRPVTPYAARIHGLTNDALTHCPPWPQVAPQVHDLLGTAWICAHNAHTDHRVLSAHLPAWHPTGVLDTLRLAKATHPDLPAYSLDTLITHLRPDLSAAPAQRHRATYDAYATAQLLIAMATNYPTFADLAAAAVPPGLPGAPQPDQDPTLW
ncbi:3'-5' exonuclease [Actinacidiphila acididurans]|uniref:3'-5' exonuclease n=1 Tax=Actinacidiphila acididurans TaxID=2784346 RepID=A0ABS2TXH9_9ACTN|nr:3'-5' exonuclease [Actinacidiphila acididurans]MBM9508049.1 3'-5' exonuclease [Actinacidiphila acididurans]